MNTLRATVRVSATRLTFILLSVLPVPTPSRAGALASVPEDNTEWQLYEPVGEVVLPAISRDDQAYHLRVMGNQLLECTSGQVELWDLTTPVQPVLLTAQVAGGRVAAQKGDHLITNGTVFRPQGSELEIVATFSPGDSQQDGFPHGSAVSASFVFLAQSKRILVLNAVVPGGKQGEGSGTADVGWIRAAQDYPHLWCEDRN